MRLENITDPCGRSLYREARRHGLPAIDAARHAREYLRAGRAAGPRGLKLLGELADSATYAEQWNGLSIFSMVQRDEDRADRCIEAAKHGADGSTHAEVVGDFRRAVTDLCESWETDIAAGLVVGPDIVRLEAAIDAVECWHAAMKTLDDCIG